MKFKHFEDLYFHGNKRCCHSALSEHQTLTIITQKSQLNEMNTLLDDLECEHRLCNECKSVIDLIGQIYEEDLEGMKRRKSKLDV